MATRKPAPTQTSPDVGNVELHRVLSIVPTSAAQVAALQAEAEADSEMVRTVRVTDAETYELADAMLTSVVRAKDAAKAMCQSATLPLYGVIKTVEGWFRPYAQVLGGDELHLKSEIGNYRLALAAKEREERAAALAAARANDAPALLEALGNVAEAQAKPEGRATIRFEWAVKRVVEDLLPDKYWSPDMTKIEAEVKAQGYTGDEPPVIAGVVFERRVAVGARR